MNTHETPELVARVLARWAPQKIARLLDPATGNGALVSPLLKRISAGTQVVCFDTRADALRAFGERIKVAKGASLKLVNADFLSAPIASDELQKKFDCIVMNPPFGGRRTQLVEIQRFGKSLWIPTEAAFLLKCLSCLKDGGRILGIFPSSIVSGQSLAWLRRELVETGCVKCVHELPPLTFRSVDGLLYLFVFESKSMSRIIHLRNHRLLRPDQLSIPATTLGGEFRLDYRYHQAIGRERALRAKYSTAGWVKIKDIGVIRRGECRSPVNETVLHTTDRQKCFWKTNLSNSQTRSESAQPKEIYMARVGRGCALTIGIAKGSDALRVSDCIYRISVAPTYERLSILFSLRCMLAWEGGVERLERGAGAKYITASALAEVEVPMLLSRLFPKQFALYRNAVSKEDSGAMCKLEGMVRALLEAGIA